MKSTTYARLVLFLPFLFLLGAWIYLLEPDPQTASGAALHNLSFMWASSALFWVVPYTHLVLCLLIWSRHKSFEMIAVIYSLAPCALAVVTLIAYTIIQMTIWIDPDQMWEDLDIFTATSLLTVLVDLVVGYVFVGIALLLFVVLKQMGFVQEEQAPASPV